MMRQHGNKGGVLIPLLLVANLMMLAAVYVTVLPNFRGPDPGGVTLPEAEGPGPEDPSALSTSQRPALEDFQWYLDGVLYDGVPADGVKMYSPGDITGGWKGLIIYDPDNLAGENALEFLNVNIEGSAESLILTLDWYLMFIAGAEESLDETDMEDGVYQGQWEGGSMWASGAGTIHLDRFYTKDGSQYAVGTLDTPDGVPALMALVRP